MIGKVQSPKKGFRLQKTGIAKAKKYKNRIYLRKKGDDKNRKKKDFFPRVPLFPSVLFSFCFDFW